MQLYGFIITCVYTHKVLHGTYLKIVHGNTCTTDDDYEWGNTNMYRNAHRAIIRRCSGYVAGPNSLYINPVS